MKKLFIFSFILFFGIQLFAQAPESFKYQAVVRDASGAVIPDQTVGVQIQILEGTEYGSAIYVETHSPTTNSFGLINFNIGEGSVQNGTFSAIDWGSDSYFLKVGIDINGGIAYTDMGTNQLLSVPYALNSKIAENYDETDPVFLTHDAFGVTGTGITNWNTAYGWGNHATAGYLTSYSETDPIFLTHDAYGVTGTGISNWNTAYGWGNHASAGYLTSFSETDPQVGSNTTNRIPRWNGSSLVTGAIYDNGTNIGIGTSNPIYKLDVNGSIVTRTANGFRLRNNAYSSFLRNDGSHFYLLFTDQNNPDGSWNSLRPFYANLSTGNVSIAGSALNIVHGGNVGIGTTLPEAPLDVKTNAYGYALHIEEPGTGTEEWQIGVDPNGDLNFFNGTEYAVSLLDAGSVIIGAQSGNSAYKLNVYGERIGIYSQAHSNESSSYGIFGTVRALGIRGYGVYGNVQEAESYGYGIYGKVSIECT